MRSSSTWTGAGSAGEAPGDLGLPRGDPLADDRGGVHIAVEHDGQASAHVGLRELAEGAGARRVELHRYVGLAGVLVDGDARGGEIGTGEQRLLLDDVGDLPFLLRLAIQPPLVEELVALGYPFAHRPLRVHLVVDQLELEQRGLADESFGALGILHARELDEDPIVALLLDGRLGDAELVHAIADGLEALPDGQLLELSDLARAHGEDDSARRLIRLLGLEGCELGHRGLGRAPRLGRGQLHHQLGGTAPLDALDGHAALLQRGARAGGRPLHLRLQRLVEVDAQDEMDAALEVEPEIDGRGQESPLARGEMAAVEQRLQEGRRVEIDERAHDDDGHDADPQPEVSRHQALPSFSPAAGTMRPIALRSKVSFT